MFLSFFLLKELYQKLRRVVCLLKWIIYLGPVKHFQIYFPTGNLHFAGKVRIFHWILCANNEVLIGNSQVTIGIEAKFAIVEWCNCKVWHHMTALLSDSSPICPSYFCNLRTYRSLSRKQWGSQVRYVMVSGGIGEALEAQHRQCMS